MQTKKISRKFKKKCWSRGRKISSQNRRIFDLPNQFAELTKELEESSKDTDKNEEYDELRSNLNYKGLIDDKNNF